MDSKNLKLVILICLALVNLQCESRKTKINEQRDKDDAIAYLENFYADIENLNFEHAAAMFGKEITFDDGVKLLKKLNEVNGKIISSETTNLQTTVSNIDDRITKEYIIYVDVIYEKGKCEESFTINNEDDAMKMKIVNYHSTIKEINGSSEIE